MSAPSLVCLDLGGVVLRICRSWREGCAAAGVPHDPAADPDAPALHAARTGLLDRLTRGLVDVESFYAQMHALLGGKVPHAHLRMVHERWIMGEYPGVAALVDELNAAGIATACLSNTDPLHWEWMERHSPAFRSIRSRHASHLMGLAKPDPAIFRAFAGRMGTRPGDIALFDDLQPNVAAARAAGWTAFLIDHMGDTAAQMRRIMRELGMPVAVEGR